MSDDATEAGALADTLATEAAALQHATPRSEGLHSIAAREAAREAMFGRTSTRPTLGRYRVLKPLGVGAMGEVFAAEDPDLGRNVAIKVLHRRVAGDAENQARLREEAKALARLAHPYVATVYELAEDNGQAFVVMELVEGMTLRQWCESAPRDLAAILTVFRQCAWGLHAAHEAEIIHRDFKPDNVMVSDAAGEERLRARVLDFGLATDASPELQVDGSTLVGTPAYLAPEQYAGAPADARSDQWAFCVALHEALFGVRPHDAQTLAELRTQIESGQRVDVDASRAPAWLRGALDRGLSRDPAERFDDMAQLARVLDPRPGRRRRLAWMGVGGSVVLAGAVGVSVWSIRPTETPPTCDPPAAIASLWPEDVRARLAAAFANTGLAYAAQSWERLDGELTAYAGSWRDAYRDACAATHLRHEQSAELLDLRNACLDERRDAAQSLLDALEPVDADTVGEAVQAARSLPQLAACSDRAALIKTGISPQERERVRDLTQELAVVRTLRELGRYKPSVGRGAELMAAEKLESAPWLQAEATLELALSQRLSGEHDDAAASGRIAFRRAVVTGRDDVAIAAATLLATVEGYFGGDKAQGRDWLEHADAFLERHPEARLEAGVLNVRGVLALEAGATDEARAHHTQALALRREALGPDHYLVGASLNNLAAVALDEGRNDEAVAGFREALEHSRRSLGADNPDQLIAWQNLAIVIAETGRRDEAEREIRDALALAHRIGEARSPVASGLLHHLGDLQIYRDAHEDAVASFDQSLQIARELGLDRQARFPAKLANYAIALVGADRSDDALRVVKEAIALEDELSGDAGPFRYVVETNAALVLAANGDLEEAERLQGSALARKQEQFGADSPYLVNNLLALAGFAEGRRDWAAMGQYLDRAQPLIAADDGEEFGELRARWAAANKRR